MSVPLVPLTRPPPDQGLDPSLPEDEAHECPVDLEAHRAMVAFRRNPRAAMLGVHTYNMLLRLHGEHACHPTTKQRLADLGAHVMVVNTHAPASPASSRGGSSREAPPPELHAVEEEEEVPEWHRIADADNSIDSRDSVFENFGQMVIFPQHPHAAPMSLRQYSRAVAADGAHARHPTAHHLLRDMGPVVGRVVHMPPHTPVLSPVSSMEWLPDWTEHRAPSLGDDALHIRGQMVGFETHPDLPPMTLYDYNRLVEQHRHARHPATGQLLKRMHPTMVRVHEPNSDASSSSTEEASSSSASEASEGEEDDDEATGYAWSDEDSGGSGHPEHHSSGSEESIPLGSSDIDEEDAFYARQRSRERMELEDGEDAIDPGTLRRSVHFTGKKIKASHLQSRNRKRNTSGKRIVSTDPHHAQQRARGKR